MSRACRSSSGSWPRGFRRRPRHAEGDAAIALLVVSRRPAGSARCSCRRRCDERSPVNRLSGARTIAARPRQSGRFASGAPSASVWPITSTGTTCSPPRSQRVKYRQSASRPRTTASAVGRTSAALDEQRRRGLHRRQRVTDAASDDAGIERGTPGITGAMLRLASSQATGAGAGNRGHRSSN